MPHVLLGTKVRGFRFETTTKPDEVRSLLGEPSVSWEDNTELCWEYHLPDLVLRFYWEVGFMRRFRFKNADIDFESAEPKFQKP
jgi:hypothetical protein